MAILQPSGVAVGMKDAELQALLATLTPAKRAEYDAACGRLAAFVADPKAIVNSENPDLHAVAAALGLPPHALLSPGCISRPINPRDVPKFWAELGVTFRRVR